MITTQIVHWPGKDTPACEKHARGLATLAAAMGFTVSATLVIPSDEMPCANCVNEKRNQDLRGSTVSREGE